MLERNTSSVTNVGRPAAFPTVSDTRGYIKGRDPIRVKNVRRASNGAQTSLNIRESTPARSRMGVLCVGNVSVRAQPSLHTRGLTLEKSLINVLNAGKALDRVHTLSDTKGSTEIKSHCFDVAAAWLFWFVGWVFSIVQKLHPLAFGVFQLIVDRISTGFTPKTDQSG